jgi:DNA repair protein RadA/Sms
VAECKKMGFTRCVIPENNLKRAGDLSDIEIVGVKTLSQAMDCLF